MGGSRVRGEMGAHRRGIGRLAFIGDAGTIGLRYGD